MWEEIEAFVKHWEGSIPQSVAIATVKQVKMHCILWFLTTYEVSWNFVLYFRTYRQNNISTLFTFAVATSYHINLHLKMVASISQVSQLWMQTFWEPEVILKNCQPCSFQFYQTFMDFFRFSLWNFSGFLPKRGTCYNCIRGCVWRVQFRSKNIVSLKILHPKILVSCISPTQKYGWQLFSKEVPA